MTRINELLLKIEGLEAELEQELRKKREDLEYTIQKHKIRFSREVRAKQHEFLKEMAWITSMIPAR